MTVRLHRETIAYLDDYWWGIATNPDAATGARGSRSQVIEALILSEAERDIEHDRKLKEYPSIIRSESASLKAFLLLADRLWPRRKGMNPRVRSDD